MKPKDVDNRNNKNEVEGLASCHQVGPVTQAESLQRKKLSLSPKTFPKENVFFLSAYSTNPWHITGHHHR